MDSGNIAKFMDLTNGTEEKAVQYLEFANGDVDFAISMYFDNEQFGSPNKTREPEIQIRDPIPQKRETLVENVSFGIQRARAPPVAKSAFELADVSPNDPYGAKKDHLANLFRAPLEIMFQRSFEEASRTAAEEKKYLMINVIDPQDFSSQVQNRDLWKDSSVQEFVKSNFVFMQIPAGSEEGRNFRKYYPFENYPHISLIDPVTGERAVYWSESLTTNEFLSKSTEFLEKYPFGSSFSTPPTKKVKNQQSYEMSEEEQLQMALAASMAENNDFEDLSKYDQYQVEMEQAEEESDESEDEDENENEAENEEKNETAQTNDVEGKIDNGINGNDIIAKIHPQPEKGENVTSIPIRFPDGTRQIFRFYKTDKVRAIYEHLKATIPNLQEHQNFELVLFNQKFREKLDQSIEEAGLVNAAVSLTY